MYGKAKQRVGTQQPADGGARTSSPTSVTSEIAAIGNTLESWQDLQAEVKTVVKILSCRSECALERSRTTQPGTL